MKRLFIWIAFYTILCFSCMSDNEILENSEFFYMKDSRTNLCFAYRKWRHGGGLFTYVPCTPEVEALIAVRKIQQNEHNCE